MRNLHALAAAELRSIGMIEVECRAAHVSGIGEVVTAHYVDPSDASRVSQWRTIPATGDWRSRLKASMNDLGPSLRDLQSLAARSVQMREAGQ